MTMIARIQSADLLTRYLKNDRLEVFFSQAETANRSFNLYSRNLKRNDLRLLAAESLLPLHLGWITAESGPILDIGSGWGIPAVPLLLFNPNLNLTLVERSQKKSDFLELTLKRLHLKALVVACDLDRFSSNSKYNIFTARGVAVDADFMTKTRELSVPGGYLIYFGSACPEEWLNSAELYEYSIDNLPVRKILKYAFV